MRSTAFLLRGAKGYGWYSKFLKEGNEGFNRRIPPTEFDWEAFRGARPKAYFDVASGSKSIGRLTFELADDVVPNTVENFRRLVVGQTAHGYKYAGTKIHNISRSKFLMGGDVVHNDGSGSHSAFSDQYIVDENFIIPHSTRGLISLASVGRDTGGSQFYISLSPQSQMNGRCVVFGRIIEGDNVLDFLETAFTFRGIPSNDIIVTECGILDH